MIHAQKQRGFTLVELVVVVAIIVIISGIAWATFKNINKNQGVDSGSTLVRSMLEDARSRTLASRDDTQYGIHFESGSTTLFVGATFSHGGSQNEIVYLPSGIEMGTISLTGGVDDVLFERLTGSASATGTLVVSLVSDASASSTVTVQETGLISID